MSDYDFSVDDILAEFYKDIDNSAKPSYEEQRAPEIKQTPNQAPQQPMQSYERAQTDPYSQMQQRPQVNQNVRPEMQSRPQQMPQTRPSYDKSATTRGNIDNAYEAYIRRQNAAKKQAEAAEENPYTRFVRESLEQEKVQKAEPPKINEEVVARAKRPAFFDEELANTWPRPSTYNKKNIETYKRENFIIERDEEVDETDSRFSKYHDDEDVFDTNRGRVPVYKAPKRDRSKKVVRGFLAFVFMLVSSLVLVWAGLFIHPQSETMTFSKTGGKTDLISRLDTYANNSKVDVLSSVKEIAEKAQIKKVYKIPEDQKVAPTPNSALYGTSPINDTSGVKEAIAKATASGLLDGQTLIFDPDASFYYDSDIQYYYDETILVICWKQQIDARVTSFCEVKIADASQIRRKLCEDTYGSSVYVYCSELAKQANAVVAMNSDYYAFRDLGITCYDRTVYRFNEYGYYGNYMAYNVTDTLFIDDKGDFNFFYRGTETTKEDVQNWVNENNLLYSIAFGPILVDNHQLVNIEDYPVGEINTEYSRAGLAQVDNLHYLYMAVSHSNDGTPRCTVPEFAVMFYNLGVDKAYCFDGGQTGELYFNGKPYNHIDFGNERTVSDIIYFATAIGAEVTS